GGPCSDEEIDDMYEQFLPLQKKTLRNHSVLIDGAAEVAKQLRQQDIKIGSSTGYTQELMIEVAAAAKEQGYDPDCILGAEDAPRGRPAPFLLFEAAKRMNVYPMSKIVKVDDTPVGIQAGINAGCWTIGVSRTGNCVGLSVEEIKQLSQAELNEAIQLANDKLFGAGAHFMIESVTELFGVLKTINSLISQGRYPQQGVPA
ncbi:MAG: HAD-IA family hydrolase, partial [Planctomycetota bacterium]|nr:HAD-IA family hydrolase [Planctomycetota bacterium]